jgi:hypothetical protein
MNEHGKGRHPIPVWDGYAGVATMRGAKFLDFDRLIRLS